MHVKYNNVNDAFHGLVSDILFERVLLIETPSRVGDVIAITEPVTITYKNPLQRVLFNEARDCNPFFHLMESIWMLAGANDVEFVAYYNNRMREFSDNGTEFHGAYGYRWRGWFGYDQLDWIIQDLRDNPDSRRCVLQIWDSSRSEFDDDVVFNDPHMATHGGKDVPCNTQAYFRIVNGRLDITVTNRSNDLVWGALGANAVHFSYLLEYMANCIGVPVGRYHQVTNNLHVYKDRWTPEKYLEDTRWLGLRVKPCPFQLVEDRKTFDRDCVAIVQNEVNSELSPYLQRVVIPMMDAFAFHKWRDYPNAYNCMQSVEDPQWQIAGITWLYRRERNWRNKHGNPYTARINQA